ncbi:MAG: hypothetical protein LCH38_14395 [Proteobacteria bacterium]|nr:hypothetical protein [Pseudomonadota bacterium]
MAYEGIAPWLRGLFVGTLLPAWKRAIVAAKTRSYTTGQHMTDRAGWRFSVARVLFILCVLVPSVGSGIYLFTYSADQYEVDISFAVRQGNQQQRSGTGLLAFAAQMSGFSGTSQETFMVMDYLSSTSILIDLRPHFDIEAAFSGSKIDWLSRLEAGLPVEEQIKYWRRLVIPEVDTRSGIINIKVRSFSAKDAKILGEKILQLCETLVNEVSVRTRQTTLKRVGNDVQRSAELLAETRQRLQAFRDSERSIDPVIDAEQLVKLIAELQARKAALDVEINTLKGRLSADSPVMVVKAQESRALDNEIESVSKRLTGIRDYNSSVSSKLVEYETLKVEQSFREKLYEITLSSYETARDELIKQQIFVIPITRPNLPESATHPRKFTVLASIVLVGLAIWSVLSMIAAAIKDHLY